MKFSTRFNKLLIKFKLIPSYNEDTLFLTALAFILLYTTSEELRIDFYNFTFSDFRGILVAIFILIGLYLSLYHTFSKKSKSKTQKSMMLFFVVFVNVWAGIVASNYLLVGTSGLLLIFPIWNLINAFYLFFLFRFGVLNENAIVDRDVKPLELIVGSIVLLLIFYLSNYIYKNHWSITFSIAVGYATTLNDFMRNIFSKKEEILSKSSL